MALKFRVPEEQKKDEAYWGQPLWYRIYTRVIYALGAFILVGALFDVWTPAPLWMQILLGGSVALATLLFRVAYPNGFSEIWDWIMEGMQEAATEMEQKGQSPKISSLDIANARKNKGKGSSQSRKTGNGKSKKK